MELIKVTEKIEDKIEELQKLCDGLDKLAENKSEMVSRYDKNLAKIIIGLRNGKDYNIGRDVVQNPPTTIIEKVAKGLCWIEKLDMDKADTKYKIQLVKIEVCKSIVNAFQSIYRHQSHI